MTGKVIWVLREEPDEATVQAVFWVETNMAKNPDPESANWIIPMDGPIDPEGFNG